MEWEVILYSALALIVVLLGFWNSGMDGRIKNIEKFRDAVPDKYVRKDDFDKFAADIKDHLVRIEGLIEKLRS